MSKLGALVGLDVDNQGPLRAGLAWVTALKVAREGGDPVSVVDHVAIVDVAKGEVVVVGARQVFRAAWGVRLAAFGAGDRGVQDANVDKARNTTWVCASEVGRDGAGRETLAVHSQSQIISEYRLRALSRKDRDVWWHSKGATDLTLGVVVASRHEDGDLLVVQLVHLMSCRGGCPRHELPARGPPSCAQFDRSEYHSYQQRRQGPGRAANTTLRHSR